jgi:hypothetical protein
MGTLRFPVGRQRIGKTVNPSEAMYARSITAQMNQIIENAETVIEAIEMTSLPALEYALQPMFDTSQFLVPVKSGKLKRSGFIEVRRTRRQVEGIVGYARAGNPHYAVYVHENMFMLHKEPTQAKFLQQAVVQHMHEVPIRYADFVKRRLGL